MFTNCQKSKKYFYCKSSHNSAICQNNITKNYMAENSEINSSTNYSVNSSCVLLQTDKIILVKVSEAICKPRHWNLGMGIGIGIGNRIGTDITNAIISSYIRPADTKPSRVVTYDEGTPPTKSLDTSISWSRDK